MATRHVSHRLVELACDMINKYFYLRWWGGGMIGSEERL